jgi:hypothetical protein
VGWGLIEALKSQIKKPINKTNQQSIENVFTSSITYCYTFTFIIICY